MASRIVTLPGDGIGPEIMAAATSVLALLGDFELEDRLVGGASIDAHGTPLTDEVLDARRGADAVLAERREREAGLEYLIDWSTDPASGMDRDVLLHGRDEAWGDGR